ncbi:SapC [Shewanella sp. P1-14-1]|uniref:SapC family protein n=1 Tax=Shewanella sp. P1-14-1 TaxID=1723761 RepID=UPI0006D67D9C|nr:SapC family protein [Shewanella sp. P1-14-1]KPZ70658.1 SapC [Shewanella sp. P1-14-1]
MNNVIVDPKQHLNTAVLTQYGKQFGDNVHYVPVIADELRKLVIEYPCCLLKNNQTGQFGLHALLGFESGENLFLTKDNWDATMIPMHVKRQPFMLARLGGADNESLNTDNTALTIDMNAKRVVELPCSNVDAKQLFENDGSASAYLKDMHQLVYQLAQGIIKTDAFITTLIELDLIEAVEVSVTFIDGQQHTFNGLYVINETELINLTPAALTELTKQGYLQACYLMIASMGNIQKLIKLKNQQLQQAKSER